MLTMRHPDAHTSHNGDAHDTSTPNRVLEVRLRDLYNGTECAGLEAHLAKLLGVSGVHLDRTSGVAHLSYDPAVTTPQNLEVALQRDGYKCDCRKCAPSSAQPGHPQISNEHAAHAGHAAKSEHAGRGAVISRHHPIG